MTPERFGERDTSLDVAPDLGDHLLQELAVGLLLEDVEAPQKRHSGAHHGRELAGHDGEVAPLYLLEPLEEVLDVQRGFLLDDVEHDQPALAKLIRYRLLGIS